MEDYGFIVNSILLIGIAFGFIIVVCASSNASKKDEDTNSIKVIKYDHESTSLNSEPLDKYIKGTASNQIYFGSDD